MQWIWVQKKANQMYSFSFSLFNYIAKQLKINDCNHSEWIFTAYVRDFDILVNVENSTEKKQKKKPTTKGDNLLWSVCIKAHKYEFNE